MSAYLQLGVEETVILAARFVAERQPLPPVVVERLREKGLLDKIVLEATA